MSVGAYDDFGRQVASVHGFLLSYARGRMRLQHDDALDLVQETMMLALRAKDQFKEGSNLKAWLFTIMRNRNASVARRFVKYPMFQLIAPGEDGEDTLVADVPVSGGQEEALDLSDALRVMAAGDIPSEQLSTMLLAARGHSLTEIAEEMGVPEGTVKSRIGRGRRLLREILE